MVEAAAHGLSAEGHAEAQENKADNFIPKGARRFDKCRDDVFEERPSLPDSLLLPHNPIVTNAAIAPILPSARFRNCR